MQNDIKFVSVAPKTYTVKYVENQNNEIKKSPLSAAARSKVVQRHGSNYISENQERYAASMSLRNIDEARSTLAALESYEIEVGGSTGWCRSKSGPIGTAHLASQKRHYGAMSILRNYIERCERGESINASELAEPESFGMSLNLMGGID